ncbi:MULTISPECIES: ABC transporter permease [unclassified Streptomyces]|uniref:ABC transporter permease n=1 Tax=unclassified Streptomyces TaxID=2593676 RepID=UPI002E262310
MNAYFHMPSAIQHSYTGLILLHLQEALVPVLAGLLLALPIGLLCVHYDWLYAPVLWTSTVLYAIPSIAFFVVLIDYTGLSLLTVMIPLCLYSLVVLVPAVVDGVRSVPEETNAAASAMGIGLVRRYFQVQLPIAVPAIMAGLRVSVASSISLVSVGALIGNQGAFGNVLTYAQLYGLPRLAVTAVVTTAVLAVVIDALLVLVRRVLTPWQPPSSGTATGSGATTATAAARAPEGAS